MDPKDNKTNGNSEELDLGKLLEERAKLDSLLKKKFIKQITVMFTDLKDSTSLAESEGDLAIRFLIKRQNDILFPIIKKNDGVIIKTMGDGTLSYFKDAQNAVRAAAQIQKSINEDNKKKVGIPIYLRIGLHTGSGIVEHDDIFGDVVNVASRFESEAKPGEIYFFEDTYNSLTNKDEIFCRFVKETHLKGKKEAFKIFKAFWNEEEIKEELLRTEPRLEVSNKDELTETIILAQHDLLIGRSNECDIVLDAQYISRHHARLYFKKDTYFIEDMKSGIGVIVNTTEISDKLALKNRDEIVLGAFTITFLTPPSKEETDQFSKTSAIFSEDIKPTKAFPTPSEYKLIVRSDKEKSVEYTIADSGLVIGRLKKNDVSLADKSVSRQHAKIWCEEDRVYIEDLGSRNGTSVDGKKITKTLVKEGQEIEICSYRLYVTETSKKSDFPYLPDKEE